MTTKMATAKLPLPAEGLRLSNLCKFTTHYQNGKELEAFAALTERLITILQMQVDARSNHERFMDYSKPVEGQVDGIHYKHWLSVGAEGTIGVRFEASGLAAHGHPQDGLLIEEPLRTDRYNAPQSYARLDRTLDWLADIATTARITAADEKNARFAQSGYRQTYSPDHDLHNEYVQRIIMDVTDAFKNAGISSNRGISVSGNGPYGAVEVTVSGGHGTVEQNWMPVIGPQRRCIYESIMPRCGNMHATTVGTVKGPAANDPLAHYMRLSISRAQYGWEMDGKRPESTMTLPEVDEPYIITLNETIDEEAVS